MALCLDAVVAVGADVPVAVAMVVALNSVVWKLWSIAWTPASVQQLTPPPFLNASPPPSAADESTGILSVLLLPEDVASVAPITDPLLLIVPALMPSLTTLPLLPLHLLLLLLSLLLLMVSVAPWDQVPRTSRSNSALVMPAKDGGRSVCMHSS